MAQTRHEGSSPLSGPSDEPARPVPSVPEQREPQDAPEAASRPGAAEVVVRLDVSDEALDRVVLAARHAAVGGMPLRLLPGEGGEPSSVARERMDQQLGVAAELAHAVAPDVEVRVGPGPA